jgi:leader peptidase (prepilin peptidase)/N-methyltransferase
LDTTVATILLFLSGLLIGSFLTVVAHRVPAGRIVVGGARAAPPAAPGSPPTTTSPFSPGWCSAAGRVAAGAAISPRYPLTELVTGALYAATTLVLRDDAAEAALGLVFVTMLVAITLTDLERRIIPNKVLLAGSAVAVAIVAVSDPSSLPERAIAAATAGGLLLAAALAYPRGMGLGDVKLAATMGLFLGRDVAPAILVALLAGSIVGLAMIARHGAAARKRAIPFGPFLALGGVVGLFAGEVMVDWYLGSF